MATRGAVSMSSTRVRPRHGHGRAPTWPRGGCQHVKQPVLGLDMGMAGPRHGHTGPGSFSWTKELSPFETCSSGEGLSGGSRPRGEIARVVPAEEGGGTLARARVTRICMEGQSTRGRARLALGLGLGGRGAKDKGELATSGPRR